MDIQGFGGFRGITLVLLILRYKPSFGEFGSSSLLVLMRDKSTYTKHISIVLILISSIYLSYQGGAIIGVFMI
jgi:hypothetical protein